MAIVSHSTEHKYEVEHSKRYNATTFHKRADILRDPSLTPLAADPWADHDKLAQQPPLLQDGSRIKFLVIGAGHAGLIYSAQLVQAGFAAQDIVLVDTAGGFGGTWYWNRYPGLCCDVEGYCYLPLLEETGHVPTHRYSRGEEIRQNAEMVADHFGLRGMFCTKFLGAGWDEEQRCWTVALQRQLGARHEERNGVFTVRAQFLIATPGPVPNPSAPTLPGFGDFMREKAVWHTARWNYDYTGGSQDDPQMVNLKDKVVGIIGTGATAVQAVPELAKWAKHLYVFQRTPVYCGPHVQSETTPELWARVAKEPGWQYKRMENLDKFYSDDPDARPDDNWVDDGRTHYPAIAATFGSRRAKDLEPGKLTPWYPGWCKRPAYHATYLETFNRPNVTLVDTDGQGVQAYTRRGVVVGGLGDNEGREYPVDALVLATGYQVEGLGARAIKAGGGGDDGKHVIQQGYRGRGGRQFAEKWASPDFGTVLGQATNGFPNLFFQTMSNIGISGNSTPSYIQGGRFVAHVVKTAHVRAMAAKEAGEDCDTVVVEATKEAEDVWTGEVDKGADWFAGLGICAPTWFTGYQRLADKTPEERRGFRRHGLWPAGPLDYADIVNAYIQEGSLKGFSIST
ncbi:hypothetical protein PG991_012299 [Apiospora marii]|uniref:FAD/NAD(P)-binding domain-containing protein n=1 Tax=Apiospora marii TaxID=335849 RepID=A0ABR1R9K8_9PEZI